MHRLYKLLGANGKMPAPHREGTIAMLLFILGFIAGSFFTLWVLI